MNNKIIAMYIRISSNNSAKESFSVSNQRKLIREFVRVQQDLDDTRVREFIDDGYSGTNFNRPKIKELLELCKQGRIECIIVKDFSRFGRSYLEVGNYIEQLFPFLGIRFISINDQYDSKNLSGITGGIDVAFQNLVYELYSKDLSQKVYSAIGNLMKNGTYLPGTPPYGYRNDREKKTLVPDKSAAAIVQKIFAGVANGKTTSEMAHILNAEGVLVPLLYKQKNGQLRKRKDTGKQQWNRQKILRIIHNEKYIGTMVYRKHKSVSVGSEIRRKQKEEGWIRIEHHHEPIVDRNIFNKANANIKKILD